ncbi:hypothetical protein BH23VER1_BH23VER1_02130 [soil metagenome]
MLNVELGWVFGTTALWGPPVSARWPAAEERRSVSQPKDTAAGRRKRDFQNNLLRVAPYFPMNRRHTGVILVVIGLGTIAYFARMSSTSRNTAGDAVSAGGAAKAESPVDSLPASSDKLDEANALRKKANVPIEFWGKVVDTSGSGIPNVRVEYRVQKMRWLDQSGIVSPHSSRGSLTSDSSGMFSIFGETGTSLSIELLSKEGYEPSKDQRKTFGYSLGPAQHVPNRASPEEYVMLALDELGTVNGTRRPISLSWDGEPQSFDLEHLTPDSGGKLRIVARRSGSKGRFDWSVSVTVEGGAVQEAMPGTGFVAPADGYKPRWECGYLATASRWGNGHDADVYYKIGETYGRLRLQIYAYRGPDEVSIYVESFINTSGGRTTERR